jgi:hypothetical protein
MRDSSLQRAGLEIVQNTYKKKLISKSLKITKKRYNIFNSPRKKMIRQ